MYGISQNPQDFLKFVSRYVGHVKHTILCKNCQRTNQYKNEYVQIVAMAVHGWLLETIFDEI